MSNEILTKKELKQRTRTNIFFIVMESIGLFLVVGLFLSTLETMGDTSNVFLLLWNAIKVIAMLITTIVILLDVVQGMDDTLHYTKELKTRYGWQK